MNKNIFVKNSQYIVPKIIQNKKLLDFDIYKICVKQVGNLNYLYVYYGNNTLKQRNYIDYLLKNDLDVISFGLIIFEHNLRQYCMFIIPTIYNVYVNICLNCPECLSPEDILETSRYFHIFNLLL